MENLKCEICGKKYLGDRDCPDKPVICDECQKVVTAETLGELSNGKGDDENE